MEKILKYSAVIYALLLFLGYSYMDTYYGAFGINIYSFLEPGEVVLSFMSNINLMVMVTLLVSIIFVLPIVIVAIIAVMSAKKLETGAKKIETYVKWNEKKNRIAGIVNIIFATGNLIYIGITIVRDLMNGPITAVYIYVYVIILAIVIFFYFKLIKLLAKYKVRFDKTSMQIGFIFLIACSFNYLMAIYTSKEVLSSRTKTKFSFEYFENVYLSSDSLMYIGATSKYIFIRNIPHKKNMIFEKSNIKNLNLSNSKGDMEPIQIKPDPIMDTIPCSLPEKTSNLIYRELSDSAWKDANFCLILFDPSYMTLCFSHKDKTNDALISSGFMSNRILRIRDRTFGIYFMSDYVLSRQHMNTGPIQNVTHERVKAYDIDYVGDLYLKK